MLTRRVARALRVVGTLAVLVAGLAVIAYLVRLAFAPADKGRAA